MWGFKEIFVLSDLHLAAERDKGLFRSDMDLANCLRWILTETQDSLILLAGDIFDFSVLSDGSAKFDLKHLEEQTQEIFEYHPEVFEALTELAHSSHHLLVIMGGDHDSELIFPAVQEAIERRLGIDFINPAIRWLVQGEALRLSVGNAVVLVEHGNFLDPWNRIDHVALQSACYLASRNLPGASDYQPPPGSQLMSEVVSEFRRDHSWVDCLKPQNETLLPLLWHFAEGKQQRLIFKLADEYFSMKAFALNKKLSNARAPERLYLGDKETENSPRDCAFKEWVSIICEQESSFPDSEKNGNKLLQKLQSVSARDLFFELEQPDDSARYLRPIFEGGANLVIHGHTHSAKACAVEGGFYINTGTWGELLRLPQSDESAQSWQSFLDRLETSSIESFTRPTFARVRYVPQRKATTASLLEWHQQGPQILSTRSFIDRRTGWQKDC